MPVSKQRLTSLDNQIEKNNLKFFNRKTGIPLGPADLVWSKASITFIISPGAVGLRKNEHPSGLIKSFPFLSR